MRYSLELQIVRSCLQSFQLRFGKLIELSRYHRVTQGMIDPAPSEIVITSLDEKLIEKAIKYVEDNMSRTELSV